ncbi:hypothetical protein K437DRAFT_149988 [Tilletiaria anomala UBC 951]|uniref:Uncharacterized protein n=1 Tax=Tilletiaria anomala (strain ATCC 24038 / CBS 436.72 / UBC 951) TaxID=1037660 RepID=A0A066WJY9_TILAU|nr:uncharacterized protein K437DRAFT_149988 [Tilletiaria anomala UBC 951]KDN52853.1 hypothetical protein K437DRAFT_149988 [Tilletiaria anomala UBC 951]
MSSSYHSKYAVQPAGEHGKEEEEEQQHQRQTASSAASRWAVSADDQQQESGGVNNDRSYSNDDEGSAAAAQGNASFDSTGMINPAPASEHSETGADTSQQDLPPNPHLTSPLLYLSNVPVASTDKELAQNVFGQCLPVRLRVQRDQMSAWQVLTNGTVEFQSLYKAELAYATVSSASSSANGNSNSNSNCGISLSISSAGTTADPTPHARPRLIKQLPPSTTAESLFPLLRPYGPIHRISLVLHNPHTGQLTGFRGMALIDFYDEAHADSAQRDLHCSELDGRTISISVDTVQRKTPSLSAGAAEFTPSGAIVSSASSWTPASRTMNASAPPFSAAPRNNSYNTNNPPIPVGPGSNLQYNDAAGTYIDPCNLFVKNLPPTLESNDLFQAFRSFGRIVSARVMRDEQTGKSREFGFVSFTDQHSAAEAMRVMNGCLLDGHHAAAPGTNGQSSSSNNNQKGLSVSLHEPKRMRQEKLAAKFGGAGAGSVPGPAHSRPGSSGSPSLFEHAAAGASGHSPDPSSSSTPPMRQSGGMAADPSGPVSAPTARRPGHERRGSNSYFRAAMEADANAHLDVSQLAALSPSVRNEVLAGLFDRRVRAVPTLADGANGQALGAEEREEGELVESSEDDAQVQAVVAAMVARLSLAEAVEALRDPAVFVGHVHAVQESRKAAAAGVSGEDASAPPAQNSLSVSGLQVRRTNSSSAAGDSASLLSAAPASSKERARILKAIQSLQPSLPTSTLELVEDITDLLVGLPKKDRALCLFNQEVLRAKVEDAKEILEMSDGEDGTTPAVAPTPAAAPAVAAPQQSAQATGKSEPVGSGSSKSYTLAQLAALPASEIIALAQPSAPSSSSTGLPLPKADPNVVHETDAFIDTLAGKLPQDQKQKLGDLLFKKVKSFGVKGAPKITIALLDSEDLRALAHLMNSYPECLKEKVLQLASAPK